MNILPTEIDGAFLFELQPIEDERGYFARRRSDTEFLALGLDNNLGECSVSSNAHRGTLRGMHYQIAPHGETKLVTCIRGAIFDAIVDLRKESPTYMKSFANELSSDELNALYIPAGVAHGFLTLEANCVVQYDIGGKHAPDSARGVRWNDPEFAIRWPLEPTTISPRDASYEDYLV